MINKFVEKIETTIQYQPANIKGLSKLVHDTIASVVFDDRDQSH